MLPRWLLLCLLVLACSGAAASIPWHAEPRTPPRQVCAIRLEDSSPGVSFRPSAGGLEFEHPLPGFYCLGLRHLDPASGRWTSPDPLGHAASLSLYDYADNDPVNRLDPDGRFGKQVWSATKQDAAWALDTFNNAFYGTAAGAFKLAGVVDVAMQSQFGSFNPEYSQWNQGALAMEANYNLAEKQGWYQNNNFTAAVQNTASMVGPMFAGKLIPSSPAAPLVRTGIATDLTAAQASDDFVTLFHGTTSNASSKIVANGFRAGGDGAVFFADEFSTAQHFALEAAARTGAQSSTVMKLQVPTTLAEQIGLTVPRTLGEFRGAVPLDIPNASGFERILNGGNIGVFNEALSNGTIPVTRLRVGK